MSKRKASVVCSDTCAKFSMPLTGECEAQSKALHHCKNCDILMCDACLEKTHTQSTSKAIQKHQIAPTRAVTSKQVSKVHAVNHKSNRVCLCACDMSHVCITGSMFV